MNTIKKIKIVICISYVLIFISCQNKNSIIATFKGGTILQKEFDYAVSLLSEQDKKDLFNSSRKMKDFINNLGIKKISYHYAKDNNIINLAEISNSMKQEFKTDLIQYLFKKEIKKKQYDVTGSDIEKFASSLKIKLIWLKTYAGLSQQQRNAIDKQAHSIHKLLKQGKDFGELANQYSDDNGNFKNGYLEVTKALPFKFLKQGQLSDIVKTELGYHIFKMNRIDVSHILIKTNNNGFARIQSIYQLLKKGVDFGILANEYSEDASNFKNGDISLFYFTRVYLPISEAAYNTKPGTLSDIVKTKFGFFIIYTEQVNKPDKKQLNDLKNNKRFLNSIKTIKENYYSLEQEYALKQKIYQQVPIHFNASFLTNNNVHSNDIVLQIPDINLKLTYKQCLPDIVTPLGPKFKSDIIGKSEKIYEKLIFNDLAYYYAKSKKYDLDENFVLMTYQKFYSTLYQNTVEHLNFDIPYKEDDLKQYYEKNKLQYNIVKVINNKPVNKQQSFIEAKPILIKNFLNERRQEEIEKWKDAVLKKYKFTINLDRLDLKKDADYYIKLGDYAYDKNDIKSALNYYHMALKKEQDYTEAYIKILLCYQKINNIKEFNKTFENLKNSKTLDVNVLLSHIKTSDKTMKIKFIELIGITGNSAAENELIELYKQETDVNIIYSLIRTLGFIKAERSFSILFNDLKNINTRFSNFKENDKEIVRWYLIEAMGYIGNKEVIPYLLNELTKTNDVNLKCFIIEALGRLKDKRSIPVLEKLLKDKVWGVRVLAAESLKSITGKEYKIEDNKGAI